MTVPSRLLTTFASLLIGSALVAQSPTPGGGYGGSSGGSGSSESSGSASTSGSSGSGSPGTSGTSGSHSGSSGSDSSASECASSSSGASGSSGAMSSGSPGTSGSSGTGSSPGTSGTSGSCSGSSGGSSNSHSGPSNGSSNSDGSSGDCSSGSAGTSGSSGAGSVGTSGSSGSCSGSSAGAGSSNSGSDNQDCGPQHLPTITKDCFTIVGCGLSGVTSVDFGAITLDPNGVFGDGSWTIINDHKLEVCPPLCLEHGEYTITYSDANGVLGTTTVIIDDIVDPTLVCEPMHMAGTVQCVFLHSGDTGKEIQFTIISPVLQPTVIPGFIDLDIGGMGTNYLCGPAQIGECVKDIIGLIPASGVGMTLHFQGLLLDFQLSLPFQSTNVCSTTYF